MTGYAFHGSVPELVAVDAKSHGHVDSPHRHRSLPHVTMASYAAHFGADMRRVVEFHMGGRAVIINALPGNIFAAREQGGHFFDFGLVGGNHLVARHAKCNVRNAGDGALLDIDVAIDTFHPIGQVNLVRVGDRLHGIGFAVEEIPNGVKQRAMGRGKNGRTLPLRWLTGALLRRGRKGFHKSPG